MTPEQIAIALDELNNRMAAAEAVTLSPTLTQLVNSRGMQLRGLIFAGQSTDLPDKKGAVDYRSDTDTLRLYNGSWVDVATGTVPDAASTVTGPDSFGASAVVGTGTAFAREDHDHGLPAAPTVPTGGTPAVVLGTTAAAGSSAHFLRDDDTIVAFDTTAPVTQAFSDSAAVGTAAVAARRDHKHGMPASPSASGGTPAIVLSTAAAAGSATTFVRTDDTVAVFDTTAPTTIASGASASAGSATKAARRDHTHGAPSLATPKTSRSIYIPAIDFFLDSATNATLGSTPNLTRVVAYADAATQGAFTVFRMPADASASQTPTIRPHWAPGSADASSHAVAWNAIQLAITSGSVTAAGNSPGQFGQAATHALANVAFLETGSAFNVAVGPGDIIRLTIQRVGGSAGDTYVGVVNLIGVQIDYTSTI